MMRRAPVSVPVTSTLASIAQNLVPTAATTTAVANCTDGMVGVDGKNTLRGE
jgi:hypothetical protein